MMVTTVNLSLFKHVFVEVILDIALDKYVVSALRHLA